MDVALASNADILITGDDDLLSLKYIGNTAIITPREFVNELNKQHTQDHKKKSSLKHKPERSPKTKEDEQKKQRESKKEKLNDLDRISRSKQKNRSRER